MDQHRDLEPGADFEDLVEARIVDVDALALAVLQVHAEVLEDFQTLRAVFDILLELRGGARAVVGIVRCREIDVGEDDEAILVAALLSARRMRLELVAVAAAQVHHDAQIELVHVGDQLVDALRRQAARLVIVHVDERIFGARDRMLRDDQGGLGLVLLDGHGLRQRQAAATEDCEKKFHGTGIILPEFRMPDFDLRRDLDGAAIRDRRNPFLSGRCSRGGAAAARSLRSASALRVISSAIT